MRFYLFNKPPALAFFDAAEAERFDRKREGRDGVGGGGSRIHEVAEFGKSERFTF